MSDRPEPDRIAGAIHPRDTKVLIGQVSAEADFLDAYGRDRLHHAWLITGPRGVGKATLAWKIARFLLAESAAGEGGLFGDTPPKPTSLDISDDHPVSHRLAALSEPCLYLVRRPYDEKKDRLRQEITVDEVRGLKNFFALSAADGGRRVVIVDAADEMNTSAANALLKLLEEPPKDATLLLISHQPSGLLPTIRSRCRVLRLHPLSPEDMAKALEVAEVPVETDPVALATLAAGSVGEALRLINLGGIQTYYEIVSLFSTAPKLDRQRALKLAESAVGKNAEPRFGLLLALLDLFLARLARAGVSGRPLTEAAPGEAEMMARLASGPNAGRLWAELQQHLGARARHGKAVNLDPAALILDMVLKIDQTAAKTHAR
ncbi:DNA polymerase III subunit delta' [Pseudohalocynthiibacter aestuariivivens]|jgi:DNA polymerase III subunit delta'|uniref:DNA polymerase III subunit delta n=1 Tax=Pseudohalocynthiibacter aestuariivivens TaxID=1591409 RepID=A0ABV5JEF9_9RHOB|nr:MULTISPECIES: DNA polymerase III subunit delta' [Pseudohalocynthiibacter]MBS9717239.1 DNA polymerase III subunit delta' [Pseudohalocynthiibacter aestuariivivens]MCK0103657.1 DNA polymerase III subunit delta' [Pseudohalocynthiibacter sp. F2068]